MTTTIEPRRERPDAQNGFTDDNAYLMGTTAIIATLKAEIAELRILHVALTERATAMEDALYTALPFVEDWGDDAGYKPGVVTNAVRKIRTAINERK